MKKKLMIYMLTTLMISLALVMTFFIIIVNYQYTKNTKKLLAANNELIINMLKEKEIKNIDRFIKNSFKNNEIRVTYIDNNGKVISDSLLEIDKMDNHNNREEVIQARREGYGYKIRHSASTNSDTMYFTTSLENGYIIRSSVKMNMVTGFEGKYIKYYMFVIFIAISMSFLFSSKLSRGLVKPIKDLEFITSRITAGELDRRVNIYAQDEIGHLSETFNNMAEKLQFTLNDALDKQNKLEAILKSMDSGVIAIDKNFKVIMINPYAKKIFGIDKDIIGKNLLDHIRNFELEDIFKNKLNDYREIKIIWPKERDLRIKTADINNGKQLIGTVAVVQDVTDIKRLENIRSQFVANVSHELKTPLTSIKGFAETLRYVEDSKNKEKFLDIINEEAERLTRLINDILTLSDIENIKGQKEEYVDINTVIESICYLVKSSADKKDIKISIKGEKLPKILGDKDRFKQMLINIVDNAIKYTENGGSIVIGTKKKDNEYLIWVEDTGVGIPKEHLDRLFERFYRVDKARSRAQGGTGLGLAIVKHILVGFNGNISVESEVGKGSKFIISIPERRTHS
ncbi:two-component system phosphate regulon sensor histidine kinase PhoR [Clostridium tetanomorphum]|uniref:two-component system histidine kinase PnpS n=1 Tax=Clostridium tetanomorphum TaxID=1553 RepID=UPI00044EE0AA|nr:HAMP domain-containing sensor histidine kinase [Clostridium tetanomorphum]KAJ52840.1 phosphate regulon sensor protein phoR [Clostridium tetanomorphum DSM 665]MBP1865426.1 two-component system phosphate regulon sensor histidine kinase PhoR [Clostridium tetanomorphum]NRS84807.1 two-component system phosphate regulon sensor histidine kinase PhoR [Clostridium tetanomorphum]SQB91688.1 phosphate regulon sensor protein phoR [Clostridium tetanomorphum]